LFLRAIAIGLKFGDRSGHLKPIQVFINVSVEVTFTTTMTAEIQHELENLPLLDSFGVGIAEREDRT
jgi:hypothetical protein